MMYIVIKHNTHLKRPTLKGKTACIKRHFERVDAELLTYMGRMTNPSYNFLAGSEVPTIRLSVRNYVVFLPPDKLNQPTTSRGTRRGALSRLRDKNEWNLR
jgi:hypothetical protein